MFGLKNTTKRALLLSAAASVAMSTPAFAQIDEIIVTAQKRSENIQDVPISITAIPAKDVNAVLTGGGDILSLANRTPGLYAESSNGRTAPRFYIRGLGNSDFALQATQPVSVIMDDVVKENVLLKSFPLFDIEQVEVLRGPQGTLFGRNTPAGIVKITTKRPTHELDINLSGSYGTYGSSNTQAAFGGSIVEDVLAVRVSGAFLRRSDYVDNTFTGQKDVMGGFRDVAGRVQFLWTPADNFETLLEFHGRNETGTATLFRANILTTGSNKINSNYVKDAVAFDGGANNPQAINSKGASATFKLDFGNVTATSISAYDVADGLSRGDIDGGNLVTGPGFIPFPSDTGNEYDTTQFTQEFRLASNGGEVFNWQVGAFFFNSTLEALTDPGFVAPSVLFDDKNAWAVFGQASYEMSEETTLTVGIRYTDDEASLHVENAPGGPVSDVDVQADEISWDVSLNQELNDDISVYARIARGFRGPSIQGRDVAFFGAVTTAEAETINSYELGFKSILAENSVRLNGSAFYYVVNDQQFTAVGGTGNNIGLVNADKGVGYGFEIDAQWAISDNFNLTAGLGYAHTEIKDENLAVAVCGSGQCTPTDLTEVRAGQTFAFVDGNPFPNAPEITANFVADYHRPLENGRAFIASFDGSIQGKTNLFLYESLEYNTSGNFELGAKVGMTFEDDKYELALFARNLTDEVNLAGGIDFNNNTGFVTEPRIMGVSFRINK
ncbi:MAG: TonB-dependent receptor [Robiginitomaculum sp.]|nr:MAG: TonB-dependent receptor [Robiginitomaculum sp.]